MLGQITLKASSLDPTLELATAAKQTVKTASNAEAQPESQVTRVPVSDNHDGSIQRGYDELIQLYRTAQQDRQYAANAMHTEIERLGPDVVRDEVVDLIALAQQQFDTARSRTASPEPRRNKMIPDSTVAPVPFAGKISEQDPEEWLEYFLFYSELKKL